MLHKAISEGVINANGKEIRFLRSEMGMMIG